MCAFFGVSVLVFSICFAKILKFRGFLHQDLQTVCAYCRPNAVMPPWVIPGNRNECDSHSLEKSFPDQCSGFLHDTVTLLPII